MQKSTLQNITLGAIKQCDNNNPIYLPVVFSAIGFFISLSLTLTFVSLSRTGVL
jgi:hypothetical protein